MIMVQLNIDGVLLYKSDPHDDIIKKEAFSLLLALCAGT